jgi:transposase
MRPGTSGETTPVRTFARKKPARKPFPAHRPRERVIRPDPTACACCGSTRLAKLGEDVTETLEVVPRQWKVVQTVREKFTCWDCERISQPPAPFHVLPRGFAGPSLLAMILFEKYGQHQPLNRQAERYAREGIDLSLSTLADQVGNCSVVLRPLYGLICTHVFAGERVHGDDTPVTATGRAWVYVRDDRPFGGRAPARRRRPCSSTRDRAGEHPERHLRGYAGILQADAYAGVEVARAAQVLRARRRHRRSSGPQAALVAPLALEPVKRIDAIFDVEREINGLPAAERCAVRTERAAPLVADLEARMRTERSRLSRHAEVAKAMGRFHAFPR